MKRFLRLYLLSAAALSALLALRLYGLRHVPRVRPLDAKMLLFFAALIAVCALAIALCLRSLTKILGVTSGETAAPEIQPIDEKYDRMRLAAFKVSLSLGFTLSFALLLIGLKAALAGSSDGVAFIGGGVLLAFTTNVIRNRDQRNLRQASTENAKMN